MNMWIKSLVLILALGAGSTAYAMDKVNLNTASVTQLESVKGVGPKLAGAIVAYRQAHHGFKSLDELKSVKGIGDKKYVKIKNAFSLGAMKSTKP